MLASLARNGVRPLCKDSKILDIAVLGAGRMGQALVQAIAGNPELRLAAVWARAKTAERQRLLSGLAGPEGGEIAVSADLTSVLANSDVAIDFSLPEATHKVLDAVSAAGKPLVIGVSGLSAAALAAIEAASRTVPILYDRNMSLGIAVLDRLLRQAVAGLGPGFEAEIHETHHIHKIDAPSGTALQLGASLAAARNQDFESVKRYEPTGLNRPLAVGEIGFEVTRKGQVSGEHTIILYSASERLELKHSVTSVRVFADGALKAARWLSSQRPGLYMMRDMFFETGA